jgi:hypothetical protein
MGRVTPCLAGRSRPTQNGKQPNGHPHGGSAESNGESFLGMDSSFLAGTHGSSSLNQTHGCSCACPLLLYQLSRPNWPVIRFWDFHCPPHRENWNLCEFC